MPGYRARLRSLQPRLTVPALVAAAMFACALAAPSGAAAGPRGGMTATSAAAKPSPNLGPANYGGYCTHLGFVDARITPEKEWACLHSDNTTSPLDGQAACEFTYPQRPIAAAELAKGVPYTWQCYLATP